MTWQACWGCRMVQWCWRTYRVREWLGMAGGLSRTRGLLGGAAGQLGRVAAGWRRSKGCEGLPADLLLTLQQGAHCHGAVGKGSPAGVKVPHG